MLYSRLRIFGHANLYQLKSVRQMKIDLVLHVDVTLTHSIFIPHLTWKLPWQVEPPCSRKSADYVCDNLLYCNVNTEAAAQPCMQTVV